MGVLCRSLSKKRLVLYQLPVFHKNVFKASNSNFKERLIDKGCPQTIIENLLSDIKFIERESALLKHNNKRGKRNIAFRDTVPALSVYFKRSFNEKMESYTKPTVTLPNF